MISIGVDKRIQDNFDKAISEALIYNKRQPKEIVNSTLFFVVRGAIKDTRSANKGKIRNDLLRISRKSPTASIAAILVNYNRGQKGEPGLNGPKMSAAVDFFIKNRQNHRNYLRSRWIPANKIMSSAAKYKSGAARLPSGLNSKRVDQGGAEPATTDWKASGYIFAVIDKLKNETKAGILLNQGLNQSVREETQSKLEYIIKKKIEEGIIQLNRS